MAAAGPTFGIVSARESAGSSWTGGLTRLLPGLGCLTWQDRKRRSSRGAGGGLRRLTECDSGRGKEEQGEALHEIEWERMKK